MTNEATASKIQGVLWWITSIAVSVLCCSILFVLFASYLVDIKTTMRENQMRINTLEARENALLLQLESIHKASAPSQAAATPDAATAPPAGSSAPVGNAAPSAAPATTPDAAKSSAPAEVAPPANAVAPVGSSAPVISPPTINVPSVPTNSTPPAK